MANTSVNAVQNAKSIDTLLFAAIVVISIANSPSIRNLREPSWSVLCQLSENLRVHWWQIRQKNLYNHSWKTIRIRLNFRPPVTCTNEPWRWFLAHPLAEAQKNTLNNKEFCIAGIEEYTLITGGADVLTTFSAKLDEVFPEWINGENILVHKVSFTVICLLMI